MFCELSKVNIFQWNNSMRSFNIEARGISEISKPIWSLSRSDNFELGVWSEGQAKIEAFDQEEKFFQVNIDFFKLSLFRYTKFYFNK